jgi:hypothetical protein
MVTNREMFENLESGSYVKALRDIRIDGDATGKFLIEEGREYIWLGRYEHNRSTALVMQENSQNIRRVDTARADDFVATRRVATEFEKFLMVCLVNWDDGHRQAHDQINRLDDTIRDLRNGIGELNQFLNDEATERDWCSDYEAKLDEFNQRTSAFQLVGRTREFTVPVRVTAVYETEIVVKATSPAEALEKAQDEYGGDMHLLRRAQDYDSYPGIEVEWDEDGIST